MCISIVFKSNKRTHLIQTNMAIQVLIIIKQSNLILKQFFD